MTAKTRQIPGTTFRSLVAYRSADNSVVHTKIYDALGKYLGTVQKVGKTRVRPGGWKVWGSSVMGAEFSTLAEAARRLAGVDAPSTPKTPEFPDTEEGARALISEAMSEEAATALLARLDRGTAALVPDSAVTGVWGLIDTNYQARIVLYLIDGDFEADENWVDEVIRTHAL